MLTTPDDNEDRRHFGQWLQQARFREGFSSQKEFAKKLGITGVHLSRIENGTSGIGQETLDKAIELLKLDGDDAYRRAGYRFSGKMQPAASEEDEEIDALYYGYKQLNDEEKQELKSVMKLIARDIREKLQQRNKDNQSK